MEKQPFRYTITSGYGDSFSGRSVKPSAVMGYLEDSAAEHCRSIGRDIFTLREQGGGWVLNSAYLKIHHYPVYGQQLIVETWISSWKRFSGIREYRLRGADGKLLAEGGGRFVYWNLLTRKPQAIPAVFLKNWHRSDDSPYRRAFPDSATPTFSEPLSDNAGELSKDFTVLRGDVDLYGHLHNTSYMNWLMEAVPEFLYRDYHPKSFGLRFYGEALLGQTVRFSTWRGDWGWVHEVKRLEDNRLLARGSTEWEHRQLAQIA